MKLKDEKPKDVGVRMMCKFRKMNVDVGMDDAADAGGHLKMYAAMS